MTGVRQRLSGLSERWKSLRPTTRRVLTLGAVFVLGGLLSNCAFFGASFHRPAFRPCWYIFFEREKRGSLDTAQRSGTDRRERPCPTRATKSGSAFLDADADAGGGSGRHGPLQGQIRDGRNYGKKG